MKKFFLVLTLFFIIINNTYSYDLKTNDYILINKIINKIQTIINKTWYKYKEKIIISLEKYLKKLEFDSKKYLIMNEVLINTKKISFLIHSNNHYSKYKINIDKVKKQWLNRHNIQRKKLNLNMYSIDERLNNSSYEWSQISQDKWVMEHKRHYYDEFYDYMEIEKWFNQRDINCEVINRTTTSESIWRFGYFCSDDNCTEELLESLKVIFDIYMNEKKTGRNNNAHYRAITHPNITKLWIWISIQETNEKDYYGYYVTSHYCTKFKNK